MNVSCENGMNNMFCIDMNVKPGQPATWPLLIQTPAKVGVIFLATTAPAHEHDNVLTNFFSQLKKPKSKLPALR